MATTGFYQAVGGKNESGQGKFTNKYSQEYPVGLLHAYVRGIVSNDFSYIHSTLGRSGPTPAAAHVHFRVGPLPVDITAITLKARAQTTEGSSGPTADNRLVTITLWQGDPSSGDEVQIHKWKIPDRDDAERPANDTFFDISEAIAAADLANITDASDLWLDAGSDYGAGTTIVRFYWIALEVTSSYALVEVPTYKNYVNSLVSIAPAPSARQIGTAGTTRYCYRIVPCDSSGVCAPPSDEIVVTDGNALLDATNHICLSWLDVTGASNYKVYRTCGPSNLGLGLLATVNADSGDCGTGGAGSGDTGYKDDGSACVTDCADIFNPDDFEGCEGKTTITYPAKEEPV